VGPRAGLDGCGKSRPHRDSIPGLKVRCKSDFAHVGNEYTVRLRKKFNRPSDLATGICSSLYDYICVYIYICIYIYTVEYIYEIKKIILSQFTP